MCIQRTIDQCASRHPTAFLATGSESESSAQAEKGDWATRLPLLIVMGDADDWTPATPCKTPAAANPDSVKLILYPGAYHDFDNEAQTLHELHGLALTANGDGVAHAGLNPAARAAALKDVPDFLAVLKQ